MFYLSVSFVKSQINFNYNEIRKRENMKPNELKAWRKKNAVSQAKLAKALGISVLTVSRWERGESAIPPYLPITLKGLKDTDLK